MSYLWCYDPGKTTGYSCWDLSNGKLCYWGQSPVWDRIDIHFTKGDIVVYEKLISKNPAFVAVGIEVIGVIKYLCNKLDIPCIPQMPNKISGITKWPLYQFKGISEHAKDAICHGISYFNDLNRPIILPNEFLKNI